MSSRYLVACLLGAVCLEAVAEQKKPAPGDAGPKVESKFKGDIEGLKENYSLTMLSVTVAPNRKEATHTHPGDEILFGVSGKGVVYIDGTKHPLGPGGVVLVRRGQKKALSNESSTEPFQVLAYLVLEKNLPGIVIVDEK
jgi:quercetin dioxygenase-like cupin family protein